jgi:S-adenosyl methyltransferase
MNAPGHHPIIDTSIPHPARRYNYWLGAKDNFTADRESGDRIEAKFPTVKKAAVENWRFMRRAVKHFSEKGFDQFLDIGCGIPVSPAVHEIAEGARVVYVDNDPLVMVHARALRTGKFVSYIEADLRDPDTILTDPALGIFDLTRPIVLLLVAVIHFLTDDDDPYGNVAKLIGALPPGSIVVLSSGDETLHQFDGTADSANGSFRARSKDEVLRFVDGLDISEPGIMSVVKWFPEVEPPPESSAADVAAYGVIAAVPQNSNRIRGLNRNG